MKGEDLLGKAALHEQLCLSSCILAELLRQAPVPVDIEQLVHAVGHPREEVEQMCAQLQRHGVLQPHAGDPDFGTLAADPSGITLADLFSALLDSPRRH